MKEILLTSSVLILVLSAVRLLLRGKVSRRLQYAMWLLVALRLLIPVQFGQLRFSVVSLSQQLEQNVPQVHQQVQQMEQVLQQPVAGDTQQVIYDTLLQQAAQDGRDTQSVQVQQELQTQAREQTAPALGQVLQGVWFGGVVAMVLWMCYANLSFLLRVKRGAVRVQTDRTAVPVFISEKVHGPCLAGLFRPAIYLPSGCVRNGVVDRYVLTHELMHLAHGDSFWALVRGICLCIYWLNPLVWLAAVLSKRDCELACDEAALEKLGEQERFAYGRTLVDMVARASSLQHLLETATSMSESKKQLTERVDFIVKKRKTYLIAAICLVLVAALAAGCSFAGPGGETNAPEPQPSTQPTEAIPVSTVPAETTEATEATGAYDSWRPAGARDIAEVWQKIGLDELLPMPPVEWGRQKAGAPLHSVAVEVRYESVAVLNQYVKQLQEAGFNLHQGGSLVASNAQGYTVVLTGETMWDYACIRLYWPEAEFKNDWKDHLVRTTAPGSDIPEPPATNWLRENSRFYLEGMDYKSVCEYIQTLKSYGFSQVEIWEDDGSSSVTFRALGVFTEAKITCGVWIEFDLASDSMPEGYTCSLQFFRRSS